MASSRNSIIPKIPESNTNFASRASMNLVMKETAEYDIEGYFDFDYDTFLSSAILLDNHIRFPPKGFTFATWLKYKFSMKFSQLVDWTTKTEHLIV
jgi:hypothetical protein